MRQRMLCFVLVLVFSAVLAARAFGQIPGYPAPRYPKVPHITTVEQLMPYARYVVSKQGDKTIIMRPGYDIHGGEKVLIRTGDTTDPLVIEAFRRAFIEKGATVDVLVFHSNPAVAKRPVAGINELAGAYWIFPNAAQMKAGMIAADEQSKILDQFIRAKKYDLVVGNGGAGWVGIEQPYNIERMNWFTREMLASPATTYPEEILNLVDRKGWEMIRQAKTARFTDPEGTDISWTWFPTYWQVVEGTHPEVHSIGGGPGDGKSGYYYGRGASEDPLIPGHLMGVPEGIVLPESDGEGVIVGTANHAGPYPRMEMHFKNHEVTQLIGGGEYGDKLRELFDHFKDLQYPLYPRKGFAFLVECAIGTNPKIVRQFDVMEDIPQNSLWVDERRRSGVVHWGIGIIARENELYAQENDAPTYHYHLHQYFPTYEITLPNGKKELLVNKGRVTSLDDPEIRRVAAKYGDPDELLREDWIPAIPGINAPGDYLKDYAQDPAKWITEEHRKAFADDIAFMKAGYK